MELAPIRDPSVVEDEIAKAVGSKDGLADHIGEREMLLVLDNLEQVMIAGPGPVADLVETCPNLAVLATSGNASAFAARSNTRYVHLPSRTPSTSSRREPDSRMRTTQSIDYVGPSTRCRSRSSWQPLGRRYWRRRRSSSGSPSASTCSPVVATPIRASGLRSTIEWSHDLLDRAEQRLFARLAVSPVARRSWLLSRWRAQISTRSRRSSSIVRRTDDRYWMYETIREFALERLEASGEVYEIRRRHAEHVLELVEEAEPHLRYEDDEWLDRLEAEHDNVRAALDHFEAAEEHELELRMCGAFWWVWSLRARRKGCAGSSTRSPPIRARRSRAPRH